MKRENAFQIFKMSDSSMPRKKHNLFPTVDFDNLQYNPLLQQLRDKLSPDPASTLQETEYFTTSDGIRLFTRHWFARDVEKKGVIIAFHGLSGDSEYFVLLADQVVKEGYDVYIHDYQGHGLSDGARGDIKSFSTYVRHAIEFMNDVSRKIGDLPLFILGESLGGTVIANTLIENDKHQNQLPLLAGIVLCAPGVKLKASSATIKDVVSILGMLISYPFKPSRLSFDARAMPERLMVDGREIIDPLNLEYDLTNPLHLDRMSSRLLLQFYKAVNRGYKQAPARVNCPIIILLGEMDLGIDRNGVQDFFNRIPETDKQFILVPEAPHAMFTSKAFQPYWSQLREWINARATLEKQVTQR
ncbi:MAG TPA: alpha/beta fold hydrolase [Candidatus Lokiarchaeia archaeon]|nr:alpha/beta fold hydrolase [Candidatus Lokiarchaeia archaeon]